MIDPPRWSAEELGKGLANSTEYFRQQRMEEPLEMYLQAFELYRGIFENLLELTVDLTELEGNALEILTTPELLHAFRYLAGPPISTDDLRTVAEAPSLNAVRLTS